jgi:hypothetical protein
MVQSSFCAFYPNWRVSTCASIIACENISTDMIKKIYYIYGAYGLAAIYIVNSSQTLDDGDTDTVSVIVQ